MNNRKVTALALTMATSLTIAGTALAKTPIRLVTYGDGVTFTAFEKVAAAFNADNPDYELQVGIYPYAEYPTKLPVMIAAGSPPDVFLTWAQYKPQWAEQGLLLDVGSYYEKSAVARRTNIFPFMADAARYKGKTYGVPYDFSSMAWVIDTDRLSRTGLPVPDENWTINDFKTYAMRLNDPEARVYGAQNGASGGVGAWQWSVNFTGHGWLNDARTEVLVNDPKHIEMLQFWQDLINNDAVFVTGKPAAKGDVWAGGYAMWPGLGPLWPPLVTGTVRLGHRAIPQGAERPECLCTRSFVDHSG